MTKLNPVLETIKGWFQNLFKHFRARSISTQMIITIVLIFFSFFTLQTILNVAFFRDFYTTQEFDCIHDTLMEYIDAMNEDNNDYYDEMYEFTSNNNAYSVIVDGRYRVLRSSTINYTITIEETGTGELFQVLVPNNDLDIIFSIALARTFLYLHKNLLSTYH